MRLENKKAGDILIVRPLERSLDTDSAALFRERMAAFIVDGNDRIVLNMTEIDFLDSTGLGAIVSSLKRLDGNGSLVLCGLSDMVRKVFEITRMDKIFKIVPTEDAAILKLSS